MGKGKGASYGSGYRLNYARRRLKDEDILGLNLNEECTTYVEIDFSQNELSSDGLEAVTELCCRCRQLRVVKLYKNDLDDGCARSLARVVETCPSVEEVHLSHNHFTARGVELIVSAAKASRSAGCRPLWLRLEQNEVQAPERLLREFEARLGVCGREDDRRCTSRVCCWGKAVHLPFFYLQRAPAVSFSEGRPRRSAYVARQSSGIASGAVSSRPRASTDPNGKCAWADMHQSSSEDDTSGIEASVARGAAALARWRVKRTTSDASSAGAENDSAAGHGGKAAARLPAGAANSGGTAGGARTAPAEDGEQKSSVGVASAPAHGRGNSKGGGGGAAGEKAPTSKALKEAVNLEPVVAEAVLSAAGVKGCVVPGEKDGMVQPLFGDAQGGEAILGVKMSEALRTEEDAKLIEESLKALDVVVSAHDWKAAAFGSVVTGFGTRGCDLDLVVFDETAGRDDDKPRNEAAAQGMLMKLRDVLVEANSDFVVKDTILNARIPVLKLQYKECDIDMSFNNIRPLTNTRLLKAYASMDPLVIQLGVAVKLWAKKHELCGAPAGNLSSYALILMVIYFLQVSAHKMPCLQSGPEEEVAAAFADDQSAEKYVAEKQAKEKWTLRASLDDLLAGFFAFYAGLPGPGLQELEKPFDWGSEVVSVRLGKRLGKKSQEFEQLRGRDVRRLHIEDPFEVSRNLRDVVRTHPVDREVELYNNIARMDQACRGAYAHTMLLEALASGAGLQDLPPPPPWMAEMAATLTGGVHPLYSIFPFVNGAHLPSKAKHVRSGRKQHRINNHFNKARH